MRRKKRIRFLLYAAPVLVVAVALVLVALQDTIVYFYSPTDLTEKSVKAGERIRIGGLVEEGSLSRLEGTQVSFVVTDMNQRIEVAYNGLLPDLFREGQGIVALGALSGDGRFVAQEVLAKHDETYMPPEVADALKKQGKWQHNQQAE